MDVVKVAVPRPLRRVFDYAVPPREGTGLPAPGTRVRVPFGRASVVGVVVGRGDPSVPGLKEIDEVLDREPLLDDDLVELATWLARYYHHPIGDVYATILPVLARRGAAADAGAAMAWRATANADPAMLRRAPAQRRTLELLLDAGEVPETALASRGIERRHLRSLEEKGMAEATAIEPAYHRADSGLELTGEQRAAVDAIDAGRGRGAVHLVDGVTGSGKTEVYMRAMEAVLDEGRQALVLVPEIALTPQTVRRFRRRFGAAEVLHSGASDRQRFDTWVGCREGRHRILIGTRSAVFAPFKDLGIIVVDEEHDGSFKQTEGLHYSARDVAVKRGQLLGVPVVLGSATPAMESFENVRRGRYGYSRLTHRAGAAVLPGYRVLDVRGLRLEQGLSEPLFEAIARHLGSAGQVLVFINRRGFAPVLICGGCGWQAVCAHCDARLTTHRTAAAAHLVCHHCDRRYRMPETCPDCGGSLRLLGAGTQRIEDALTARHPDVPVYRIDRDTARRRGRLAEDLEAVRAGGAAILVGTQMLAKGHHLPDVTMVAVVDADNGFLCPDYRAPERTAQLIVQVAGRAGRANRPGEVWIQTLDPDNANLRALVDAGYRGFVRSERQARKASGMPPFGAAGVIRAESRDEAAAVRFLEAAATQLATFDVDLLGPSPAAVARRADRYRHQLLLLAARRGELHRGLEALVNSPPQAGPVRWAVDVDPLDTF